MRYRKFPLLVLAQMLIVIPVAVFAYDGYGESNTRIDDPGVQIRFAVEDSIEDGQSERADFHSGSDDLASLVTNMNYASWRTSYAAGDFDGNGCTDLAIGVPYGNVSGQEAAGKVLVRYMRRRATGNSSSGAHGIGDVCLNGTNACQTTCELGRTETYSESEAGAIRTLHEQPGVRSGAESGAFVGFSLASGDFNCDGTDDLAIGAPGANLGQCGRACPKSTGVVFIGYGSSTHGLNFLREPNSGRHTGGYTYWHNSDIDPQFKLPSPPVASPEDMRHFALRGFSLAAGHFWGPTRNCSDLAIGTPGQDLGDFWYGNESRSGAGMVTVVGGRSHGLDAASYSRNFTEAELTQGRESPREGHLLGFSLASGRWGSSSFFDKLAIGAPGFSNERGRVYVLHGFSNGPVVPLGNRLCLDQQGGGCIDLVGDAESGDRVGFSIAAGDFNGNGIDDLAVGAPMENGSGVVHIVDNGTVSLPQNLYSSHSNTLYNLGGDRDAGDAVGFSLASADFDQDGFDDLAVGTPGEDLGLPERRDAGAVVVAYGGCNSSGSNCAASQPANIGLAASSRVDVFHQDRPDDATDLAGFPEINDLLGVSVLGADISGDGFPDLITSAPGERGADRAFATQSRNLTTGGIITRAQAALIGAATQSYGDGHTHVVAGQREGLDAELEEVFIQRRADPQSGERSVVILPKRGNAQNQFGLLDEFDRTLAEIMARVPSQFRLGTVNLSVVDSIVPHRTSYSTGVEIVEYENIMRFDIPVHGLNGLVTGEVQGYLGTSCDVTSNEVVAVVTWESEFGPFIEGLLAHNGLVELLGHDLEELEGNEIIRIDIDAQIRNNLPPAAVPFLPRMNCTRADLLPSGEIELGLNW